MKWIKNNLANLFTLGNLGAGCIGILLSFETNGTLPFWCMVIGAFLDFLDGFIARATKTSSKIGADLDSLADMVTFGVLPGIMAYHILPDNLCWFGLLIPVFSAWRLAKFNNDTRSTEVFYGLPTPANALMIAGFFAAKKYWATKLDGLSQDFFFSTMDQLLLPVIIVFCLLMVSDVHLISNKIVAFSLKKYWAHLLVLMLAVLLIMLFGYFGVSLSIISYVLISIIITFAAPKK